ncbi:MAG: hypothetical protein Q9208_003923 [Pyrenodesmia sp. 3 TL-2023]
MRLSYTIGLSFLLCLQSVSCRYLYPNQTGAGDVFPLLIDATTEELETGLERGLFTSLDLVNAYTARILEVNSSLNVVTELNPDALRIAAELDAERANGTTRGPLHGMPILIKANIGTADRMSTTAGSFALLGATLPRDSGVAAKLRAAGVIILGKTNLYGAYYPHQDPSGSSSGSGVASSLGLALATLGSETSGSILSPSQVNNVVGIKPTVGLTSRALVIPISERQDSENPDVMNVTLDSLRDAAYLLQAIAGKDPNDNYTLAQPFDNPPDYVGALNYSSLRGKRIGIPRNLVFEFEGNGPVLDAFESAIQTVRRAGAIIVDNVNITAYALDQYLNGNASLIVLEADFVSDLPQNYLSKLVTNPNNVQNLADVRNFTQTFPPEDYSDRDTGIWDEALGLGFNNSSPQFWSYYQNNLEVVSELPDLLTPKITRIRSRLPALVGTPVITVPLGFYPANTTVTRNERGTLVEMAPGIPFGLSFIGPAWSEASLIGYAYAFEQRTMVRNQVQPYLVPNAELKGIVSKRKIVSRF